MQGGAGGIDHLLDVYLIPLQGLTGFCKVRLVKPKKGIGLSLGLYDLGPFPTRDRHAAFTLPRDSPFHNVSSPVGDAIHTFKPDNTLAPFGVAGPMRRPS